MLKKMLTTLFTTAALSFTVHGSVMAAEQVKNIVLVHGAFVDGSGWNAVTRILDKAGYTVSVVQEPQTSLADDIAATRRIVNMHQGRTLLVGHSYGGFIISEAGKDPAVAGLVYVAAFQPEKGESLMSLSGKIPAPAKSITETPDGFLYLKPEAFHADFAADLPKEQTSLWARSQVMPASAIFATPADTPAWKSKPSWAIVATEDRAIHPDLERFMAKRAASHTVEIKGSHAVYASQPEKVAAFIEQAARSLSK